MAHWDETTKCYLRQLRASTVFCTINLAQVTSYIFIFQKLAQIISQQYSLLQSCTMYCLYYFVLEKIGQSGCRQYFLLQSMHKSSAQLYFLLQSLYPVPSRTTAYYKPLTKYFPMLLRTAKITQNNSQYFVALFISLPAWRASVPEEESSSS